MYNLLVAIYFIYAQVCPITQDKYQVVLLAAILVGSFLKISKSTSSIAKHFSSKNSNLLALKIIVINSFIFTAYGALTNQPGAKEYLILETILPIIFLTIFSTLEKKDNDNVSKLMSWCFTFSTFLIGIIFVLQMMNFGGGSSFFGNLSSDDEVEGIASSSDGTITGIRFVPLASLSYLTPISLHNLTHSLGGFFRDRKRKNSDRPIKSSQVSQKFLLLTIQAFSFISTFLCIILSARQGLLVGFLGSLGIVIAIQTIASLLNAGKSMKYVEAGNKHVKTMIIAFLVFIFLVLLVNNFVDFIHVDYQSLLQRYADKNKDDVERKGQLLALLNGWYESPIIGHGNGSTVPLVRDDKYPWRYELGYILKLNNLGLLGIAIYFSGILCACIYLVKNFYKTGKIIYMSSLAGLLSLLIADGTNPYMLRPTVLYYLYYCLWLSMNKEDPQQSQTQDERAENMSIVPSESSFGESRYDGTHNKTIYQTRKR